MPPHVHPHRRIPALVALALALAALLSACSSSASTTGNLLPSPVATATATDTPTPTPTAKPTPVPVTSCSQVAGFGGAGSVSAGSIFSEVSFPSNTVGFVKQLFETKNYQFKLLSACTKGKSAGDIRTYFSTSLPAVGFPQTATFPYQGNASAACGDPYCWYKDGAHPGFQARRYVSLENVASAGSVTTYVIRLAIAPLVRTITIQGTYFYDFDQPTLDDVWWNQVSSTTRHMDPKNGAKLVNMGSVNFTNVTAAQLKGLTYGTTPIDGSDATNKLVNGDVFAVKTDAGHYVKVQVISTATTVDHTIKLTYVDYDLTF